MKFGKKMSKRHKVKVSKFELDCVFRKKVIAKKTEGGGGYHIDPAPVQIRLIFLAFLI